MGWNNNNTTTIVLPTGATSGARIVLDSTSDAIFIYDAFNNLVTAIAASAGTDASSGQPYAEGIQVGADTGTQIIMSPGSNGIVFAPNDSFVSLLTALQSFACGGVTSTEFAQFTGPSVTSSAAQHVSVALASSSPDGTTTPTARGYLMYADAGGTSAVAAFWDGSGVTVTGTLAAAEPGAATLTTETWHTLTLKNGWTNLAGGYTAANYRAIGSPPKSVQVVGTIVPGTLTDGTVIATLPAGYLPVKQAYHVVYTDSTSSSAGLHIDASGNLKIYGVTTGATVVGINAIYALDI